MLDSLPCSVSVIIPAYNAADTLAETIESLQQQTLPYWEAIIVDDGSQDATIDIAKNLAAKDDRLHVLTQTNQGVSAARNAGAEAVQGDWLLFLDADDWIAPQYMEQMTAKIAADPTLDVVHCGWVRVALDGSHLSEHHPPKAEQLFPELAASCIFAIHACLVRRTVFVQSGGFDLTLVTCEDWDLWQRLARYGCKFGSVPAQLAFYRLRPQSLSVNGQQIFEDGLQVIKQGHTQDSRVTTPHPSYANGLPPEGLQPRMFQFSVWTAGLTIGQGKDATSMLNMLPGCAPGLVPHYVAISLFSSVLLPTASPTQKWCQLWASVSELLQNFLAALETASKAPYLARRTSLILERMILQQNQVPLPIQIGQHYGVRVEISQPIADIIPPIGVDRLYALITLAEQELGTVVLPVCEHRVSHRVLLDSITEQYAWTILGYFFAATVYRHHPDQPNVIEEKAQEDFHNRLGWVEFLRDLWDRPDWSEADFYNPKKQDNKADTVGVEGDRITLEVSAPLPNLTRVVDTVAVTLTVGGVPLREIPVSATRGYISASALRAALSLETGFELCRVVVREALIGRSFAEEMTLRQRLAQAAQQHPSTLPTRLALVIPDPSQLLILAQRPSPIGSSSSRWATLPAEAAEALLAMTIATHEPVAQKPAAQKPVALTGYAPDAIVPASANAPTSPLLGTTVETAAQTGFNSRNYFETLFATQPDPWKYTTDYEQTKYEQTLSLLPDQPLENVLELACAEGHFTAQLAPRVKALLATDISQIAVERAAQRCAQFSHVRFQQLDMVIDPLPSSLDLIVCSEVLYYIGGRQALRRFANKVAAALAPGGYFLTAHAHLLVDEPNRPGYDWDHPFGAKGISDAFSKVQSLYLVKELHTPLYRIQLFQKKASSSFLGRWWSQVPAPVILEQPQPTPPPARVAEIVLWEGGEPDRRPKYSVTTDHLPILMYHRIAPEGAAALSQWRVTPGAFAAQLRYLRDAGYHSIALETWRQAIATNQPLPGRAIILTFDDGYLDFLTYAFPLLQDFGFSATVFLVADRVGTTNQWDALYGEELPLMTWEQVQQLQAQGIDFGSHSATHPPLTGLSLTEIVKEGACSRTILTQKLGRPINTIAYPYGDTDPVVTHLIGACGYTAGVTCRTSVSSLKDQPLALPRIDITGSDTLRTFIAKLQRP